MSEGVVLFPGRSRDLADFHTTGTRHIRLCWRSEWAGWTVLALGTGPGFLALDFHPSAGKVIGIDPEPQMLRVGRRKVVAPVSWPGLAPCVSG